LAGRSPLRTLHFHLINIQALIIRDLMARFGRNNMGFVWTILEPMILTTGVLGIWSIIHGDMMHGVSVLAMALTGYMPLTLWRHMTNPMTRILQTHSELLYHRRLSHFDIVFARAFLEFTSTTAALITVYFVLLVAGLVQPVHDWTLLLMAWLFVAAFYGGMGFMIGAMTQYSENAEKFITPSQYFLLPASGTFFMVDWMPGVYQRVLLWYPPIHAVEMFRAGFMGADVITHYDVTYIAAWSFVMLVLGIFAIYAVRDRIEFS